MFVSQHNPLFVRAHIPSRHALNHFFRHAADEVATDEAQAWVPRVDIRQESTRFVILADLPGVNLTDVEFQMVYVLKGWVKTYLEGQGETLMKEGSCWTQPPRIKHLILDYSDDVELLEVILPAEFKTVELAA